MKRYDEYIEINSPWIKNIPMNWNAKRLKSVAAYISRGETPVYTDDTSCTKVINQATFSQGYWNTKKVRYTSSSPIGNKSVPKQRDILLASTGRGVLGKVFYFDQSDTYIADGHVTIIRTCKTLNSRFLYYYLSVHFDTINGLLARGSTNQTELQEYPLKNMPVPLPSADEQDQIVRYLDWQVSKINRLIAAKKRQLSILAEYRKAKIDEIILHGDKQATQKDSGIWWLRDIPQSWQVIPLKRICQVNASISNTAKQLSDEELVTFLPMESVSTTGTVDYSEKRRLGDVCSGYSSFALNDVVIAKITPCFENGKGACLDSMDTDIGYGTTEFINLRASDRILPRYLYMITMTQPFRKLGEEMMTGSAGQKRVPIEFVKGFAVGIPPIEEQARLLALLNDVTKRIDCQTKSYYESIISLQELRTRLISDVVTGQIDVRGIEIPEFEYTADVVASEDESAEDMEPDAEEA